MRYFLFIPLALVLLVVAAFYAVTDAVTPCGAVRNRLEVSLAADLSGAELTGLAPHKDAVLDLAMAQYDFDAFECMSILKGHYMEGQSLRVAVSSVANR